MRAYQALGAKIRERRVALALKQRELAAKAKVTQNTISELERGREPSLSVLLDVCDVLELNPAELVGLVFETGVPTQVSGAGGAPLAVVRESLPTWNAVPTQEDALALASAGAEVTSVESMLGYMRAIRDMIGTVAAAQDKLIEQATPLARLQKQLVAQPLSDDLQRRIREDLVRNAQAAQSPPDQKAQ